MIIRFIGKNVIRVVRNRDIDECSPAILKDKLRYTEPSVKHLEGLEIYELDAVKVEKRDGLIKVYRKGKIIFEEVEILERDDNTIWMHRVPENAYIYGFGEKDGPLNKRGWKKLVLRNEDPGLGYMRPERDPLYINIPFYIMTKKGYALGVYIDSPSYMEIDPCISRNDILTVRKKGKDLDYYIFLGDNVRDILYYFTELVGRTYIPPLWALGYHQSKWSYKSEKEVMDIAKKFRKNNIPCDAIHLDIDYMDGFRVFTWNRKRFPDPKAMIDRLHQMGFKVVVIIDPYAKCDNNYFLYREMLDRKCYVRDKRGKPFLAYGWPGKSLMPDFCIEECRDWWGEQYLKFHKKYGIDGFWNDMNEPSVETRVRYLFKLGIKRDNMVFDVDGKDLGVEYVGNIYGFLQSMATHNALRKTGRRFFILSRSGFAGIQRYSANWTGDIWSTWKHLGRSISMLLNLGLSGVVFAGADIGGFAPLLLKAGSKLFARWIQLGLFYPFMRVHYMKYKPSQEPWRFGRKVLEISRKCINLRYRLLPYLYSLFWKSRKTGVPIIRPLFLEFEWDEKTYSIDDEFMFGPSILVAPIVTKKDIRRIYLPKGHWLDFNKNEVVISGGEWLEYFADIYTIPIFIRDGGIVVMQEAQQYVGEREVTEYELYIFSIEENGSFILYEDDGATFDYEKGIYSEVEIKVEGKNILINILKEDYQSSVKWLKVHYFSEKKPSKILVDDEETRYEYKNKFVCFKVSKENHKIRIE